MPQLLFQLGNTPELSIREVIAVVGKHPTTVIPDAIVGLELDSKLQTPEKLMEVLGGTVKILETLETLSASQSQETLEKTIAAHLVQVEQTKSKKIHFAVGEFGRNHLPPLRPEKIKEHLTELGCSARFVESPRSGLSAAVLTHQHKVVEVIVLYTGEKYLIAQTRAVQDIDSWSVRDREKPYADRKKGMLPPKLARIMVNLCLGEATSKESVLLDPFCGSGTILMEAAMRGATTVGSDLDLDAVVGAQKNLEWLKETYQLESPSTVLHSDAAHVLPKVPVTHLVTEPFLGKPKPVPSKLPNIFKGLEKQYWGAFKHWRSILAPNASLVVVFPLVELSENPKDRFSLEVLIDKLASLGYTTQSEAVLYSRAQAVVKRQIYHFNYSAPETTIK